MTWEEEILQTVCESPTEAYEVVLGCVKAAQDELNKPEIDWNLYENYLNNGKQKLIELSNVDEDCVQSEVLLNLNLKLLNNYYKHLFTRSLEERDAEALSELKYHLLEIIAAWKV